MTRLRESARVAPQCMSCGLENPNHDLLCLAHSNSQMHGRGMAHKSEDIFGAILCQRCHDLVDGRSGGMAKGNKHTLHRNAWVSTMTWWINQGYIVEKPW
jgi:hypothetical protein